jgi:hypothetical protein
MVSALRVLARTRSFYGAEGSLVFREICAGRPRPRHCRIVSPPHAVRPRHPASAWPRCAVDAGEIATKLLKTTERITSTTWKRSHKQHSGRRQWPVASSSVIFVSDVLAGSFVGFSTGVFVVSLWEAWDRHRVQSAFARVGQIAAAHPRLPRGGPYG